MAFLRRLWFVGLILIAHNGFSSSTAAKEETEMIKNEDDKSSFDFLIFAQIWPRTDCILWRERSTKAHKNLCYLQRVPRWTIHGIWPTWNEKIGPIYCHKNQHPFDKNVLKPLEANLSLEWFSVRREEDEYDFWEHEWSKHGTCAVEDLPQKFPDQAAYFKQALEWNDKYQLMYILGRSEILPGKHFSANQFIEPVRKHLGGYEPGIQCQYDHEYRRYLISQINICFDKNFNLMNCTREHGGLVQGCPKYNDHQEIFYPDATVPNPPEPNYLFFALFVVGMLVVTIVIIAGTLIWDKISNLLEHRRDYQRI